MDADINEKAVLGTKALIMAKATRLSLITENRPHPSLVFRTASLNHSTHIGGMRSTKLSVVNTQDGLSEMVRAIGSQHDVELYLGMEASLLVLHVHPEPGCSYIVDIESLGASAFQPCEALSAAQKAAAEAGQEKIEPHSTSLPSLKAILESHSIPKILFDCRKACVCLAGRFGIKMGSIEEIQCLELECRSIKNEKGQQGHGGQERDLRSCLDVKGTQDVAWDTKTRSRPLPFEVALYCVEQVRYLPGLRVKYLGRLDEAGLEAARLRTETRLGELDDEGEMKEVFHSRCGLWIYY